MGFNNGYDSGYSDCEAENRKRWEREAVERYKASETGTTPSSDRTVYGSYSGLSFGSPNTNVDEGEEYNTVLLDFSGITGGFKWGGEYTSVSRNDIHVKLPVEVDTIVILLHNTAEDSLANKYVIHGNEMDVDDYTGYTDPGEWTGAGGSLYVSRLSTPFAIVEVFPY